MRESQGSYLIAGVWICASLLANTWTAVLFAAAGTVWAIHGLICTFREVRS